MTKETLTNLKAQSEDPKIYAKERFPHYSDKGSHHEREIYWQAVRRLRKDIDET